jgi:hypothetical protein
MTTGIRVLVCGGRDFANASRLDDVLSALHTDTRGPIAVLIHGAARGADTLAGEWAERQRIRVEAYPADWEAEGRAAGPIRNKRMLDEGKPDLVIAFPGGRGTANMVKQATERGVEVMDVRELKGSA